MKGKEEKENKKRINSEVITLQKMSPNVLATHYLREANTQVLAKNYESAELFYKQAIDYFNKAISKGIAISKNNYKYAICNLATVLYNNRQYEEAVKTISVQQELKKYINPEILTNTQKSLYYNIGFDHIKGENLVIALYYLSISNALGQSVEALYNIGYVENLQKHFEAAHNYYDKAFQLASKSRQNTLVIHKAIKNNIIEYFIDLCQTGDFMDKFESLAGRKTTYKKVYEELPDSCLKHAKYLLRESFPVNDVQKSVTNLNTSVLIFNRLAKLYTQLTEEAGRGLLLVKLQVTDDYWNLLNTYSYIRTGEALASHNINISNFSILSIILQLRQNVKLLTKTVTEKTVIEKLLDKFIKKEHSKLTLEYLDDGDYDTIVNYPLEEEDICTQMAGLIQEKLSLEGEI
jgi:tetratricopeptide (TPR) repeat protein